ncbi:MAG: histidine kinase dimerization/phospho-acceptor domain-containing protein [Bilophila wadsworthia]
MSTFSWRVLRLPLLITLLWGLLLFTLFRWTAQREDEYTTGLARIQTATLFSSIVDTRDWNANNGGVWVREHPGCPANPWLPEEERTLRAEGGATLVKVNPAYMTRQIAESFTSTLASFRISSLSPKRPENRADQWETGALLSSKGQARAFRSRFRQGGYALPLYGRPAAKESCIQCHQDKKVGDARRHQRIHLRRAPFAAATERKRTTGLAFGIIGIIGMVGIGGATFQINRKKELAEAANRTKSAFLANMTHDMRTPLTGILGMTELLERETQDSRHRYLLANLRKATDSLLTVVDGIMRYSLLEADRQPTCCAPFSLRAELGACIAVLRPACASRDIRLSLVTDDTVPDRLVGDGFRLRQALGNLLGNAVKFTEKGSVTLRVTRAESQAPEGRCALSFQVIDTGRGIPTDEQERIFESFEQAPASGIGRSARNRRGPRCHRPQHRAALRRRPDALQHARHGQRVHLHSPVPSGGRLGRPAGNARLPLPRFSLPPRPA